MKILDVLLKEAILTDLGSCIHKKLVEHKKTIRVHFTWTYAHPDLTSIISDPAGISGGGLKASANIKWVQIIKN